MKRAIQSLILATGMLFSTAVLGQGEKERSKLLPDYALLQYAGSIGTATAGFGYDLGKRKRGQLELMYSYTPRYEGLTTLTAISFKGYRSFFDSVQVSQKHLVSWVPFRLGAGLSYIADSNFFSFVSDLPYSSGYYWHRTGLRSMLLFQTEISKEFNSKTFKRGSIYLEANIQDLYMTLFVADKSFTAYDMVMLGVGSRISFE